MKQSYCGYVMIIMSLFWLLETIPMAATSLLPILLFPIFGIMTSREVTSVYIQDILMLFLAGKSIILKFFNHYSF